MKRIILVLSLLLLSGCQPQRPVKVDMLIYNTNDNYMYQFANDILDLSSYDIKYAIVDSENSQILQNKQINELIENDTKILLVNPVDRLGAYVTINAAKAKDIPIIFFNREPLKEDLEMYDKAFYVGAKAKESAMLQAELVKEAFGPASELTRYDANNDGVIQLVILKGEESHQDAEIRTNVIISELEAAGYQLDILAIAGADWVKEASYEKMLDLISLHQGKIELVVSNNDAMAIGAIEALDDQNIFNDVNSNGQFDIDADSFIPVVGIDGIPEALRLVEEGKLYGTVINDSKESAVKIVELVRALVKNEKVDDLKFEITDDHYVWVNYKKISN